MMANEVRVRLMKPGVYNTIRANSKEYYEKIKSHPDDGSWLRKCFKEDPFEDTEYFFDEELILLYDDDYYKYAVDNGIRLYEATKKLPAYILYSRYFWAWINFEIGYRQAIQSVDLTSVRTFENTWFPSADGRQYIARSVLGREYIKVKFSIDEKKENKYELTPCMFHNRTLYIEMISRSLTDNPNFSLAILGIVKNIYDSKNKILSTEQAGDLLKIGCQLGSVMYVDSLSKNEIEKLILDKYKKKYTYLFDNK